MFFFRISGICKNLLIFRAEQRKSTTAEHVIGLAQLNQLLVIVEDGIRICQSSFSINLGIVGIDGHPGCTGSKTGILPCRPLNRSSCIIAAPGMDRGHHFLGIIAKGNPFLVHIQSFQIHMFLQRQEDIGHTQFFTLIDVRSSLHTMEHGCQHLSRLHTIFPIVAPTGNNTRQIVVVEKQAVPTLSMEFLLPVIKALFQL